MSTDCEGDDFESSLNFKLNDVEFDIPQLESMPPLETVLWDLESEESVERSENASLRSFQCNSEAKQLHSVISHCILQGISTQITSAGEKVEAGKPTVITNSHKYVTIGSSHGYIFNFNTEQDLCWCCHDIGEVDQGAISALAFNVDCTRLLAGYERGHILMLDGANGDVLRKLPDAHAPQSAVLHLRFTFMNNLALCGDSSGSIFTLTFNRRLGIRSWDSRCLFSGSKGEVCAFEPLINFGHQSNHFLMRNVIIAIATMSKMIIISIRPDIKCLFNKTLPCSSNFLPQIAWQVVPFGRKSQNPVVAWGRGTVINFTKLIVTPLKNIKLAPLRTVEFEHSLISLKWLGSQNLSVIDSNENFHLFDVRAQKEIEKVELENVEMVYNSAHFKALAVGGEVSEAFSLAAERACYNSICSRGNDHLLLLGTKAIHMIKLRSWPERLVYLSENGRWADALNLAADEGLNREKFTTFLLTKFLENVNQNVVFDENSLEAAVNCCVQLNKSDLLCNELWEAISNDSFNRQWYFSLLTEHIINGKLTCITPFISQHLISHLEKKNDVQTLENVLLNLEIQCLDLHQSLTICKSLKLYNAWIHLTTKTIGDYASPLMEFLNNELNNSPLNQRLGNILLVYISSCLAGLGYPNGNIPKEDVTRVKFDILRCLETQHSINCKENEGTYPYLRSLLKFNMRECLNVVELAFNEVEFSGEMGQLHRQRLVKILMEIVRPPDFNDSEEINLACFICRSLISNKLNLDENLLIEEVFEILMTKKSTAITLRDHLEREQAWYDLIISTNHLRKFPFELQLKKAKLSHSFRLVEYFSEQLNEYKEIFKCYLRDTIRKKEIFNYIYRHVDDEKRKIREQFLENFQEILEFDLKKTVEVVTEFYVNSISEFYGKIPQDNTQLKYDFLKEILSYDIKLEENLAEDYFELMISANNEKKDILDFLKFGFVSTDTALAIAKKYEVPECISMIHEKNGDWYAALDVLLENKLFEQGLEMCIRASEHLDIESSQNLWRILLKKGENHGNNVTLFQSIATLHIPPEILFELISNVKFGDFRNVLEKILMEHLQDFELHSVTFKLLSDDLHKSLAQTLTKNGKGAYFNSTCHTCHESLIHLKNDSGGNKESFNKCLLWGCGHSYHEKCLNDQIDSKMCPICKIMMESHVRDKKMKNVDNNLMDFNPRIRPDLEGHF